MSIAVAENKSVYHAEVINKRLLPRATNILIFLLPYTNAAPVEDSLVDLPFPVITTRRSFSAENNRSIFPHDIGIVMDGILHATSNNLEQVGQVFAEAGLGWLFHGVKKKVSASDYQGGSLAMSSRNRVAVTSDRHLFALLQQNQFHVGLLPSRRVEDLRKRCPDDWTYALPTHVDELALMYTNRGHSILAVDETVYRSVRIDGSYPWKIKTVHHDDARRGLLNIAFLGREHVLAAEEAMDSEVIQDLRRNRHRIVFQPQDVVSDNAGPKCRSLFLSIG